jgi:predicted SAM-dependent methyltransferase
MLRLNIGSGQRPFGKGWTNVDKQAKWNPDVLADGASLPMFEEGSADIICLHHVLEHFGCGEAESLLKECHRILCVGGRLLVFVPNMVALSNMWHSAQMDTQLYMTNVYGAYHGDEADRHKWGYDSKSLHKTLLNAGFYMASGFNYEPIPGADIAQADWILGMEAIR